MVKILGLEKYHHNVFKSKSKDEKSNDETRILPNTLKTRSEQEFQKTTSAFLDYPVKGLMGDINSNFYEFLTMGVVPYLVGSAMFMVVFNCLNNYLRGRGQEVASIKGKKAALGVVLYGVLKSLSKSLVTTPVKLATGVDVDMPYENIVYPLPKEAGENANIEVQHQQRKIFDSKEFYRKDLLDREYYDKVAEKLGLGKDLNDSITETSPIIQNIVATSGTAKSISSYAWAATGVGLAVQDCWSDFFNTISNRKKVIHPDNASMGKKVSSWSKAFYKNTKDITFSFGKNFIKSFKQMWLGKGDSLYMKHAGKGLLLASSLLSIGLTANSISKAKGMAKNNNKHTIDETKEVTVI